MSATTKVHAPGALSHSTFLLLMARSGSARSMLDRAPGLRRRAVGLYGAGLRGCGLCSSVLAASAALLDVPQLQRAGTKARITKLSRRELGKAGTRSSPRNRVSPGVAALCVQRTWLRRLGRSAWRNAPQRKFPSPLRQRQHAKGRS